MKLEPIEGHYTKWMGLWWNPNTNHFASSAINLSDLRKFKGKVRIIVRKNKFYNGGENNRPNYCFSIRDANAESDAAFEVKEIEEKNRYDFTDTELEEICEKYSLYTREQVERVKHGACRDGQSGYSGGDLLIEDYI